jgi:hypothetical protein
MSWALRLFHDKLPGGVTVAARLPVANRVIYAAAGTAEIAGRDLIEDEAWYGVGAVGSVIAGSRGATLWRWELARTEAKAAAVEAPGVTSILQLAAPIDTLDPGDGRQWLMRCDSVAFPPGGCAYTHVHQGPGIRCLRDGRIRIDCDGHSARYEPGGAWFEAGPEPVFAQADADMPTRFVRVMILPRALKGKSSIRYVNDEDKDKPKTQQYRGYVDEFIAL